MKTNREFPAVSTLTLAVQGALVAMFAMPPLAFADDAEVAALTHPTNSIEIGVGNTSDSSAKFGEYNGLNKSGTNLIGNFSVRGGDAYGAGNGINRWEFKGSDLGTTSRELSGTMSNQGQWNLGFGYDELRHNITDTYQTPFQGSMGGKNFTLPTTFGIIDTTAITGSNNPLVGTRNLTAAQKASFQTVDVHSDRRNTSFTAGYIFNPRWNFQFDYNRLDQSGAKLISGSSSDVRTGAGAAGTWAREAMVTLMNPTNYTTDTFNLAANWAGDTGFMTASYFGSFFRNADDRLSWMNPMGTGSNATGATTTTLVGGYQPNMLSTMPGNDFHQLNLTGGYTLSPTRKLTGGLSYGRNTQNDSYLVDLMQTGGLPQTSLNGVVLTKNANLKLTDQSIKDLSLSAGVRYNERDNQTASSVYRMFDIGGGPAAAANSSTLRTEINTPYSNSKTNIELAGDYRLDKRHNIRLAYDHEDVKRWCNNVAGAAAPNPAVVGVIAGNVASPAGANCVIVPSSSEDKLGLSYRSKPNEDMTFNAGYTYSRRNASVDHNALTPLNDQAGANGTGIVNASDYKGYMAFFDASREQNLVKAGVNWQAAEKLSLTVNGRYSADRYTDSTLGVQDGHSASVNLDAAYSYSDNGTVSAYFSAQERERTMKSGASGLGATDNATSYAALVAPTNIFTNRLSDNDQTIGLNARHKGLMGGKLELVGDLSLSVGKTTYHTDVPYYVPTATGPACSSPTVLSCGDTPEIYSKTLQFKLTGNYQVDKKSKVVLGYLFQKLTSNDYYYNVYQYGYSSSTLLPTNQLEPSYSVNVVTVTYVYNF